MVDAVEDSRVGRIVERMRACLEEAELIRVDRERTPEVAREAEPAVEAVALGLSGGQGAEAAYREGLTLTLLLGRRMGTAGMTPTALLAWLEAMERAFGEEGLPWSAEVGRALRAACAEGYVAARDEAAAAEADRRVADAIGVLRLSPRSLALILAGRQDPEQVARVVDEFGRTLFDTDAAACVVDLSGLQGAEPGLAAEVWGVDALARLLGAACFFSGASDAWRLAFEQAGATPEPDQLQPDFAAALRRALTHDGLGIKPGGGWPGRLRRWLGPSR